MSDFRELARRFGRINRVYRDGEVTMDADAFDDAVDAVHAALPRRDHESGEAHRYRLECEDCGEQGTLRVSVDPATAP